MLRIRLARGGASKRPHYHLVVAENRAPRDGRHLEQLGYFDPMLAHDHPHRIKIDEKRLQYWLGQGAKPSDRVVKLLAGLALMPKPKIRKQTKQHLPKAKALARQQEAAAASESEAPAASAEST